MNWEMEFLFVMGWCMVLPILFSAFLLHRILSKRSSLVTMMLLGIGIVCLLAPFRWRPLQDALGFSEIRYGVNLAPYRIEFISGPGVIERDRYFLVTRADGQQRRSPIDGDANACIDFSVKHEGSRIEFQCAGERRSSYIDTEAQTLTSGYTNKTTRIDELFY